MKARGAFGIVIRTNSKSPGFYLTLLVITSCGVYLRLDQFLLQVLLDDEWHVVHQLLVKGPKELFLTFGHADFSIPLALLYWLESGLFGLSEIGMRWPMLIAGLVTLIVLPIYLRKFFSDKTILVFSALLAMSPMLIIYSRTARPYALTLLLSLMALAAFQKFVEAENPPWKSGLVYALCAISSAWLHLITLPLVVAPFLALGLPALLGRNWSRVGRMFWLGVFTLAGLLALVLPPVLGHPEALSVKLGVQTPNLQTYHGVFYVWLGTSSLSVVLVGLFFALIGAGPLWRALPLIPSLVTGLGLTLGVILLTQPAWVHNPLTLARYLLPAIPLVLLSLALGVSRASEALVYHPGIFRKLASATLLASVFLLMAYYSPLTKILHKPNSNSLHSVYQLDFREEKNLIYQYQRDFPVSPFWHKLALFPKDSLKIAASPFSFETHHWEAARWEQISHQRVMPGYLIGFCAENRLGEVPSGEGFKFRNVGYLANQGDLIDRGFDLVVYQKPFKVQTYQGEKEFGMDTANCESIFRQQFPEPVFEDQWLVAFPLTDSVKRQFDATR